MAFTYLRSLERPIFQRFSSSIQCLNSISKFLFSIILITASTFSNFTSTHPGTTLLIFPFRQSSIFIHLTGSSLNIRSLHIRPFHMRSFQMRSFYITPIDFINIGMAHTVRSVVERILFIWFQIVKNVLMYCYRF